METILAINAHLKYVEYLLHVFDTYPDATTLKTIREEFENKFSTRHVLLNQNFGIYRLPEQRGSDHGLSPRGRPESVVLSRWQMSFQLHAVKQ